MRLNPDQVSRVVKYLQQIPTAARCSLCGQQEWKVSETIFALPEYTAAIPGAFGTHTQYTPAESNWHIFWNEQPEVFPVIPIVCGRCGFVFFISAVAAGVVMPKPNQWTTAQTK